MKYRLEISPNVSKEVAKIYLYREKKLKGAGDRFLRALAECYTRLRTDPLIYQIRKNPYRHAMLERFKYRVVYDVADDVVTIYQVRHTSRKVSPKFGP
jgi:mRNA-degrading endonuclease RelE of RelBE toxin-antitoxin system